MRRKRTEVYVPPTRSPGAPVALAALNRVPGPSPWYLEREGTALSRTDGVLRWGPAGDRAPNAGKSLLLAPSGDVLAVTDFQCYVQVVGGGRLLVWYAEEDGEGVLLRRSIRFRVFDLEQLLPIRDVKAAIAGLGRHSRFYAASGELASIAISTALDDGSHNVELPAELRSAGELLVLAHSTADGRRENAYDTMHLRLWLLNAPLGQLEIVPQDWFNSGPYDFGYQWVTRMARLPEGGDVVGEGIRLGVFRLDATKRRVAEWLLQDTFYHPER